MSAGPCPASRIPDALTCERARRSRDPRFDGLFYTAVRSTGIYCRPVCPAPAAKATNVDYYPSAAAADAAGFRPCLRCRPELAPDQGAWRRGDNAVARALALIDQGFLAEQPLDALATRVHLGERQLRRLFVERLGAAPVRVHGTRRLLFAKQLLTETALSITEVALAAGFSSLRRFNAALLEAYRMAPGELRRQARRGSAAAGAAQVLVLRLGYRPPFDFAATLGFLGARALPGVEAVDARSYARTIGTPAAPGWLRVSPWPGGRDGRTHALKLELQNVAPAQLAGTVARVRRMFDLDVDPEAIAAVLSADPRLRPLLRKHPGLRLPGAWDGFETAVRAVLGQQVSVAAARTLATRVLERHGHAPATPLAPGLSRLFPTPEALASDGLEGLGLTSARAAAVRGMAAAHLDGRVGFDPAQTLDDFIAAWSGLAGLGPWTAHYLALRALGHPDAFPAEDLVLQKAMASAGGRLTTRQLRQHAEAWRPWRAYAAIHLWRDAPASPRPTEKKR